MSCILSSATIVNTAGSKSFSKALFPNPSQCRASVAQWLASPPFCRGLEPRHRRPGLNDGGPKSLRSPCCGLALYKNQPNLTMPSKQQSEHEWIPRQRSLKASTEISSTTISSRRPGLGPHSHREQSHWGHKQGKTPRLDKPSQALQAEEPRQAMSLMRDNKSYIAFTVTRGQKTADNTIGVIKSCNMHALRSTQEK
ncbi:hypothetical protein PoB_001745200 [Plakobranchus ocellatus]|uniref:Uncharacterized protein n=1 Tax=Plakobranchus ocellatus TaxID=259542 RepID=A0AAV3Z6P3_9GAST|nr:hypothetical protein PoB_001745200 [Plakobranchus ocellatus]